ncbi:hypothetical protein [Mucilaginibacter gotjawali]|uniref:Uncharacterized protein n=2 Tax=Mucilaginibacter gotjawali TaxID=1550579 RepID=A0A110AZU2_9SPHI|nr:hypothetical protein [Mucilaginibacter gotjawali]MBB3058040.1 hypothetical protein [Mucilaginibacter gotjawali]BAU52015.1 hypothetical protein MgSA37_00165 [Mucilaginibacter gotjawali]
MNKKQLLEFIPLTIFLIAEICRCLHLPYSSMVMVLCGFLLSCLYFAAALWLYAAYAIHPMNRIIAGFSFSTAIVALMFSLSNWQFWRVYSILGLLLLGVPLVISLFNYKNIAYKQILYRSIFFIVLLSSVFGYKSFWG